MVGERASTMLAMVVCIGILLACKAREEASPVDTGVATTASAPVASSVGPVASTAPKTEAANAGDVKRFPDEKKLDEDAKLEWNSSKIRREPRGGPEVAVLLKGAAVHKIAEHAGFFLITFQDPKDVARTLMGWVYQDAFKAAAAHFTGPITMKVKPAASCAPGYGHYENDGLDVCRRECKQHTDCPSSFYCGDPEPVLKWCHEEDPL